MCGYLSPPDKAIGQQLDKKGWEQLLQVPKITDMLHSDLHTEEKPPKKPMCLQHVLVSTSERLPHSVHAVLRAFATYDPRRCPRRGSPHHKIVMHVNVTVHGSNEPWQWMLSDFKRLHPCAPPLAGLHSTCLCEECVHQTGWVRGLKFTDREEGKVTCMQDFLTCLKCSQIRKHLNTTVKSHSSFSV